MIGKKVYDGNFKNGIMDGKGTHWECKKRSACYMDFKGEWEKGKAIHGKLRYYNSPKTIFFNGDVGERIGTYQKLGGREFHKRIIHPDIVPYGKGKIYKNNKLIDDGMIDDWVLLNGKSYWSNGKLQFSGGKPGNATLYWENGKRKFKGKVNNSSKPIKGRFYNSMGELIHEGKKAQWYKFKKRRSFNKKWKL